jgi:hypothetical protein
LTQNSGFAGSSPLAGWDLYAADPPGTLVPWPAETSLPLGVHDVWCRPSRQHPWQLQLMVDDLTADDDTAGVYRRDERIRRPWAMLTGPASEPGRPVLTPEIQLLYKSHQPRPKDQADFAALSDELPDDQRRWLLDALMLTQPNHPWIHRLGRGLSPVRDRPAAVITAVPSGPERSGWAAASPVTRDVACHSSRRHVMGHGRSSAAA